MPKETLVEYSPEEWEYLRERFSESVLNDTLIAVLGQNVGISWPFKGSDETPLKYIAFDFEELQRVPGLISKKSRIKALMNILRETLAFDDPFSEMVDSAIAESEEDHAFENRLEKLGITGDYPAELIHFSSKTKETLRNEKVETLLGAIHFGQKMAGNILISDDLNAFLNGLAHADVESLTEYLPYRRADRKLHLAEAVGLIARDLDKSVQLELLSQAGHALTEEEEGLRNSSSQSIDASLKLAMEHFDALCEWFPREAQELKDCAATGSAERYFIPINEARRECVAVTLAYAKFGISASTDQGILGKISGIFRR